MTLRDHLLEIKKKKGELTPQSVVDVARNPGHALHNRFEWNDNVAGESWRREQARQLIKEVQVTYKASDGTNKSIRGFYAVESGQRGDFVYKSVDELQDDPFTRELILRNMERDWRNLEARYEDFAEFWTLVREEAAVH